MRKLLIKALSLCLIVIMIIPTTAAATEDVAQWQDIVLTDDEFDAIISNSTVYKVSDNDRASDLISMWTIGISKEGTNTLIIAGKTTGTSEVVKSGFKEVVVQRRTSSSASWSDYVTYEDLYWDEFAYVLSKSITVPTGYQYRVTCVHYAKKNFLSVQKIDNVSNVITF